MTNIVAIVGRPNVGKSTLFNRLIEEQRAIVDPTAGVTRDRQYGHSDWNGRSFSVIDTGGYVDQGDDHFDDAIAEQVKLAIEQADLLLLLVSARDGLTPLDEDVATIVRTSGKPCLLVVNKVDTGAQLPALAEFYSLGLGEPIAISAVSGSGTGDMLDAICSHLPQVEQEDDEPQRPKLAVVGRPNVGKSSFVNAITGQQRAIVSPISGTTRDATSTHYNLFGFDFDLLDTAGLRKKNKVEEDLEFYSTLRTVRALESCDCCLLMIDATEGLQAQDLHIFSMAQKNNKGIVLLVNKWDLVEKDNHTLEQFRKAILERTAPMTDLPIIFTSCLTKQRVYAALEAARDVCQSRSQRLSTSELNEKLLPIVKEQNPPPSVKGKHVKIKYITQLPGPVPRFVFFCNLPQYIREPYRRFVENRMRELWNFKGVPLTIYFRQK